MILEEYRDEYDCAPLDLGEFADGATGVTDCVDLAHAAETYLVAKQAFESMLDRYDITIG